MGSTGKLGRAWVGAWVGVWWVVVIVGSLSDSLDVEGFSPNEEAETSDTAVF